MEKSDLGAGNLGRLKVAGRHFWPPVIAFSTTLVVFGLGARYGVSRHGSLTSALTHGRGNPLVVDQAMKTMVDVRPGAVVVVNYLLTNTSSRPIRVVGVSPSCTCTVVGDLPMTFAAFETRAITANIHTSEGNPPLDGSITLFTDQPSASEILLGYRLVPSAPSRQAAPAE